MHGTRRRLATVLVIAAAAVMAIDLYIVLAVPEAQDTAGPVEQPAVGEAGLSLTDNGYRYSEAARTDCGPSPQPC